ncbi:UDP-3-O-acyl-N-acetylglucosamine deacetylase [Paralimibaculum aggregatum]|uniref:UDP-3-O-acyl-N-acetylglucosamine deacetylase n=1 Tax=Paralimibaculum aggregatum TaxID=3036245 RepID=A0ABQ6LJ49_9RHOB|nr:UDP-3-O-acyl-N-acetylglucosamine deacetylase [Limibaculum sp. NKW23]GMG83284.1 UDP-3-O-acyl-N-acetylglucosamine deacetylase [Limibaculum sp. NKW23]
MRRTVKSAIEFEGVGLHSGATVRARIRPCHVGGGLRFRRIDVAQGEGDIPARYDLVTDTRLCTKLTNAAGVSLGTVEHVMAALAGSGVTDALIEVDGPEMPIMDGSSAPFVAGLLETGFMRVPAVPRAIRILRPVRVEDGDRSAALLPAPQLKLRFTIDFPEPAIGTQRLVLGLSGDAFVSELAECRTFCRAGEVEALRRMGLARGGSLANAIVVDGGRVLNPEGLRRADEFVRHKMLDAVGDLALAGAPIIGAYEGVRAGHEMTNRLLHALFAAQDAWEWTRPLPGQLPAASGARLPAMPLEAVAV